MRRIVPLLAIIGGAAFLITSPPLCAAEAPTPPKIKALIVDGQNNHAWQKTTPILKAALESSGLFTVDGRPGSIVVIFGETGSVRLPRGEGLFAPRDRQRCLQPDSSLNAAVA